MCSATFKTWKQRIWATRQGVCLFCFADFTKAFDSLNHKILLDTLESKGVRGKPLELFTSYFADRTYSVEINYVCSKTGELRRGVPQGLVLGPKFFLFYVYDINKCFNICFFLCLQMTLLAIVSIHKDLGQAVSAKRI